MRTITTGGGLILKVDDDTYDFLLTHRWSLVAGHQTTYVTVRVEGRWVLLHRWITQAPPGTHVHHIDGDGVNNCRANLHVCDPKEHGRLHGGDFYRRRVSQASPQAPPPPAKTKTPREIEPRPEGYSRFGPFSSPEEAAEFLNKRTNGE